MRRQSIIALSIAIVLGLVAVFLANSYFTARENSINQSNVAMTRVAIAAGPLAYGQEVTPDRVRWAEFPSNSLPAGVYTTEDALFPEGQTRHALRQIALNQPLLASDLTGEGQGASIAATLPDGMRAATVQINAVSGVAGFIKPNDTVDVLVTRANDAGTEQITDLLLQNIRVIAMDQDAQGQSDAPAVSSTATLEVSPIEAQKLALGQQLGSLSLVLRKPGIEQDSGMQRTISIDDLRYEMTGEAVRRAAPPQRTSVSRASAPRPARRPARQPTASRPAPPPPPPPPPAPKVEVTRGLSSTTYEVGDYDR
ncbi:Flp pilus assembly protein CpaB [Sphingomicrobium sp. XHP0239]|uniref:Flp pilus assembly protein CpaB n=1 Tax=Sphingomicrobium maritimum TaxID=3133972 RepID=UPI0031CC3B15